MPAIRSGDLTVAVVACSALAVLTAAGAAGTAVSGPAIPGSSFSAGPGGSKAAFLTLKRLGYAIDRSYEPMTAIAADPARTVIVLAAPTDAPSDLDRRALERFVSAGGYVLATGAGGAAFLSGTAPTPDTRTQADVKTYAALSPGALAADAPSITMAAEATRVQFKDGYTAVYGAGPEVAVRAASIGGGRAVWWAGSTPLQNASIADAGNLALLLNSLGDARRTVLWDERYHGHTRSLWSYVAATPLPWAGAQAGLMALAAMLVFSRRLGPVRPAVEDPRTSPMEFVDTLGALYAQAGAGAAAVATARRRLRRMLLSASGLAHDATDERLAAAAASRAGVDRDELHAVLDASAAAGDGSAALPLVQRLQTMAARGQVLRGRITRDQAPRAN